MLGGRVAVLMIWISRQPPPPRTTPMTDDVPEMVERFLAKADRRDASGCWLWTGTTNASNGGMRYGMFRMRKKMVRANRASYMLFKGEIPQGLVVRHTCDNTLCVNPQHLIVGTASDNQRDCRDRKRSAATKKIVCVNGHGLSGKNLYISARGHRNCKACQLERTRIWREKAKEVSGNARHHD